MRLGGRIAAAAEILADIEKRQRPVADALKDWGLSNRFAGSGDRAAIGNLVYDCLRQHASLSWITSDGQPLGRVTVLLLRDWGYTFDTLLEELAGDRFAPQMPEGKTIANYMARNLVQAPPNVAANVPEWVAGSLEANFADEWIDEARALAGRPPLDLRVNTLKGDRDKLIRQLSRLKVKPTRIARHGLRIPPTTRFGRHPNVQNEEGYRKGRFEIQDEGSQIVSDLVFARPGENILDFCAGAGGKTLALAAVIENRGQIHAYDADRSRLAPIHDRLARAGTRNVQVHDPDADLSLLEEKMDKVVVDAPCTGSGTWRRRPDAKWRLQQSNLEDRLREQEEVLSQAAGFVRPGGHLFYITCSLLPEENENQVYAFVEENPAYELVSAGEVWEEIFGYDKPSPWSSDMKTVTLTPASTGTDGFFFAVLERKA